MSTPDDGRPDLHAVPVRPGRTGHGETESATVRGSRALELRMAGATYSQIAQAIGYKSKASAYAAVERALAADMTRVADIREEYRHLHLARLDRMLRAIWPKVV